MSELVFKKIECSEKDNGQRYEISVIVAAEDVDEAIEEFYTLMFQLKQIDSENVADAIEKLEDLLGEETLLETRRDYLLNRFTTAAIRQVDADYVLTPNVHTEDYPVRGNEFSYTISLTKRPILNLASAEPVHIVKKHINVEDRDIQEQLEYTARQFTTYRKIERENLQEGDFAIMDTDMTVDGKPLKKLSGKKRFVEIKKGLVPDGFIDGVRGMLVGNTREFEFLVPGILGSEPEPYSAKVTLQEIQEEIVPVVDDAFIAENLPQFETLAGFKDAIHADLEGQKELVEQQDLVVRIREAIEERLQGNIPDEMYEDARESLVRSVTKKVESQNSTLDKYCEEHGVTKDAFYMNAFIQASGFLRQNLALDLLAKERGLYETDDDIQHAKVQLEPSIAGLSDKEFEDRGLRKALAEQIRRDKAMNWLIDTAIIED